MNYDSQCRISQQAYHFRYDGKTMVDKSEEWVVCYRWKAIDLEYPEESFILYE